MSTRVDGLLEDTHSAARLVEWARAQTIDIDDVEVLRSHARCGWLVRFTFDGWHVNAVIDQTEDPFSTIREIVDCLEERTDP